MNEPEIAHEAQVQRTAADTAALLLELERGLKAFQFYPEASAERADLLDRCFRAWSHDLSRFGPLILEVRGVSFWFGEPAIPVGPGRCEDLGRDFAVRSLWRLVFGSDLRVESFSGLLEYLSADAAELPNLDLFLSASLPGIDVPDVPDLSEAPALETETHTTDPTETFAEVGPDDTTPSSVADFETFDPETTLTGFAPPLAMSPEPRATLAPPPLEVEALLEELEDCDEDDRYRELGFELVSLAERRVESGYTNEGYTALLGFARHASDDQKRSVEQRYVAERAVTHLFEGSLSEALLDHACATEADTALRASEALLVIGAPAVVPLLERLSAERDRVTKSRLTGVILAMGEEAATALLPELESEDVTRRREALRLAGESQNPRLVPALRATLLNVGGDFARDAAKALVQIGDVAAYESLVEGLQSPRADVVQLATYSLGRTGRSLFVAPLVAVLYRSLDGDAPDLAREAIRALGRLGHRDAVPALIAVLDRGGFFARQRLRELKLAVIGSLRTLPGAESEKGLRRAMGLRDRVLRDAARSALVHRGSSAD